MTLKINIHNVGHGLAVHAFTPNSQTIVIDLGCSGDFSPLQWLSQKTNHIDCLVITHPHGDHIDEILELDRLGFYVEQFWRPKWLSERQVREANQNSYSEKINRYLRMSNEELIYPIEPDNLVGRPDVSGGVSISYFFPDDRSSLNINNHSCVCVFEYYGVKVLISGDNQKESWDSLLKMSEFREAIGKADVFLASHHGRENGYHRDLFDYIDPDLCIVSDGRVQNTNASERYTEHANGWAVQSRNTQSIDTRYCLTTRNDGTIHIEIGKDTSESRPFLSVSKN
jgi:beta-lactamase superfamily II metal-dependent hydrolase